MLLQLAEKLNVVKMKNCLSQMSQILEQSVLNALNEGRFW